MYNLYVKKTSEVLFSNEAGETLSVGYSYPVTLNRKKYGMLHSVTSSNEKDKHFCRRGNVKWFKLGDASISIQLLSAGAATARFGIIADPTVNVKLIRYNDTKELSL